MRSIQYALFCIRTMWIHSLVSYSVRGAESSVP